MPESLADVPFMLWSIAVPLAGALLTFAHSPRAGSIGPGAAFVTAACALAVLAQVVTFGERAHPVGGWGAPLGIDLLADGLSVLMLAMTAVVGIAVSVYARPYLAGMPEKASAFWTLWLFLWAALNALFQTADIFNLYVTLELLGISAVALVALSGTSAALTSAMRYLLVSLLGSLSFLIGVALLYSAHGTLDLGLLATRAESTAALAVPLGAMFAGLLLKTGLFPFHVWLPPAHGSARAPVSALLSALVVKAAFYTLMRLWLSFAPDAQAAAILLALLGSAAVFWGSFQALRQRRLKLLVAYSTVAQLGYLFLAFPLARSHPELAWGGALYLVLSHALAKSAMFLATGSIMMQAGHDEISRLDRLVERMPLSLAAFALAGVSLTGLPPSAGFVGKWMLLQAAMAEGQWLWAVVVIAGGLLTAAYVFRVVGFAFSESSPEERAAQEVPRTMQLTALLLALGAVLLGLLAPFVLPLLAGALV